MPNSLGSTAESAAVHRLQAHLQVAPDISEVVGEGTDDWFRTGHFKRLVNLPVVVAPQFVGKSLSYWLPVLKVYPIQALHSRRLSAWKEQCSLAQAQHR